jgi:hypothetical protein
MNPDPENFDALRRLLALKRHEQPPPGYFNSFSSQVIARIKAGERGEAESWLLRLAGAASWWQRLSASLQSKPGFAGAFGAAVCALVLSGIVYSENSPVPMAQSLIPAEANVLLGGSLAAANDALQQAEYTYAGTNAIALSGGPMTSGSLFDQVQFYNTQPASLLMPDGN